MPQLSGDVRRARAAELRAAGEAVRDARLAERAGGFERVLVEEGGRGRTEAFWEVRAEHLPAGTLAELRIAGAHGGALVPHGAA